MKHLLLGFFSTLAVLSCAPSWSVRIGAAQTALNVLTDVANPAYDVTRAGCDAAEQVALALQGAGKITLDELDVRIHDSRVLCDRAIANYELMINLQLEARKALELAQRGDESSLEKAETLLDDIRQLWRQNP